MTKLAGSAMKSSTFRAIVATRKPDAVYLRGDKGVSYGEVIRILAVIRATGVQNVGLVAEDEEQQ